MVDERGQITDEVFVILQYDFIRCVHMIPAQRIVHQRLGAYKVRCK